MKKRIISVIFAALILSACAFWFAACDNAAGGRQSNEVEQGGNENDIWGSGTEDDALQNGGESVVRTTVTEEEWNAALRMEEVTNVTVCVYVELAAGEEKNKLSYIQKNDGNKRYVRLEIGENSIELYAELIYALADDGTVDYTVPAYTNFYSQDENGQWHLERGEHRENEEETEISTDILTLLSYNALTYNTELQRYEITDYVLKSQFRGGMYIQSLRIGFEDGKLAYFMLDFYYLEMPTQLYSIYQIFSDYGTTSVTLPEVSAE